MREVKNVMREARDVRRLGPYLILLVLVAACFSLATFLQGRASRWSERAKSGNVLEVVFGEGRRMYAIRLPAVQSDFRTSSAKPSIAESAATRCSF